MNEHETCDSLWWHMSRVNFAHSPQLGNASGLQTHQACRPTVHDVHDVLCKTVWKVCHDSDIDSICITRQSMTKDWYWDFKWLRFRGLEVTYGWFDEHVCPPAPIHSIGVLPSRPESKRYLQLTWELDLPPATALACQLRKWECFMHLHASWYSIHASSHSDAGNPLIWCSSCSTLSNSIKHHQTQAQDSSESEGIRLKETKEWNMDEPRMRPAAAYHSTALLHWGSPLAAIPLSTRVFRLQCLRVSAKQFTFQTCPQCVWCTPLWSMRLMRSPGNKKNGTGYKK